MIELRIPLNIITTDASVQTYTSYQTDGPNPPLSHFTDVIYTEAVELNIERRGIDSRN